MADKTKYFDYDTVKEMLYDLEYEGKDVDPTDYPFIEIADEHGDLIDRDKLISKIETHCSRCGADCIECQIYRVQDFAKDSEVVLEANK